MGFMGKKNKDFLSDMDWRDDLPKWRRCINHENYIIEFEFTNCY